METEAEVYARLTKRLHEAEEISYYLGHLLKEDEGLVGQGFLGMGEMFKMTALNVINLATGKIRRQGGYR